MVKIRLVPLCSEEFRKEFYRPGVISLSRLVWGSLGGGLSLAVVAVLAGWSGVGVLYPPLAATCFIGAACMHLRVARPKSVIVGHFVSTLGGLLGVWLGGAVFGGTSLAVAAKLGLAVLLASAFMQILDADHPPAAATAAIPAILPLPAGAWVLPLHMAWGGVAAVLFGLAWTRVWCACPPRGEDDETCGAQSMGRREFAGLAVCTAGFALMCLRPLSGAAYGLGLVVMGGGVLFLSLYHFAAARVIRKG